MITWLPFIDYKETAKVLTSYDLEQQQKEVITILDNLFQLDNKFIDQPVIKMWEGHEVQLCNYGLMICDEYSARGFKDLSIERMLIHLHNAAEGLFTMEVPGWMGDERSEMLTLSHQSNLIRRNPMHYSKYFKNVPNDLPFYWPKSKDR